MELRKSSWILCLGLLCAGFAAGFTLPKAVYAQVSTPAGPTDDQINAIARGLYCPVCENIPLDVCPTQACAEWRALIGEKLAEGWSERQIKDYFVDQYGDRVLATPPPRGLNWLVYVVPPLAILAGAYVLYRALKIWKQPASLEQADSLGSDVSDEYIARLEEDLRRR
jgi:cytochrome c-type biogenesis protein CcmH